MSQPMFERDILYPTDSSMEPGSVHICVYAPEVDGRMPIHITAKTEHTLIEYLEPIVSILQSDLFDRTRMDIRKSGVLYLQDLGSEDLIRIQYSETGKSHSEKITRKTF